MKVDLLSVIKELSARPDYEPGTPVYLDMRAEGPEPPPEIADSVPYECANGMDLVVDFDHQGRVLGIEVWPVW